MAEHAKWSLKRSAAYGFASVGAVLFLLLLLVSPALPRGIEPIILAEVLVAALIGALLFAGIAWLRNSRAG